MGKVFHRVGVFENDHLCTLNLGDGLVFLSNGVTLVMARDQTLDPKEIWCVIDLDVGRKSYYIFGGILVVILYHGTGWVICDLGNGWSEVRLC